MAAGWTPITRKGLTLRVPRGTDHEDSSQYTPILVIPKGYPLGPTLIGLEVRAKLPVTLPKDMFSQMFRGPESPDGPSAKKFHPCGSIRAWSDVWVIPEYVSAADLPLTIGWWHNGGKIGDADTDVVFSTVIAKPYEPTEFAAERLRVKS
jgi:hypothetical protein